MPCLSPAAQEIKEVYRQKERGDFSLSPQKSARSSNRRRKSAPKGADTREYTSKGNMRPPSFGKSYLSELPLQGDKKKQIEEQHKYGIYFDDEYNYLQHLRDTNTKMEWEEVERIPAAKPAPTKLNLPSSVFASTVEEDVGLLNKAAPESGIYISDLIKTRVTTHFLGLRLDLDPDIVAAMDDDFDFNDPENQLEDNFIELANVAGSDEDDAEYENSDVDSNFTDEERDEVCSLKGSQFSFDEEETKSRFTQYSMSSSVIRRNDQLTLLDNRFEKVI